MTESTDIPQPVRRTFGLSFPALFGLSLLTVPRVLLHDLGIVTEGEPLNLLLALGPLIAWIVIAVVTKVPQPFLTLLFVGFLSGIWLMLTHQLLWDQVFGGAVPDIGGPAGEAVPRIAAGFSSLFTGTVIGAVCGLIAWGISSLVRRRAAR